MHKEIADRYLLARSPGLVLAASLVLVAAIAVADYYTGYEVRLAILYLIPIAAATWTNGAGAGLLVSAIAMTGWLLSLRSSHVYSDVIYHYWDGTVTAASFVVFVLLLSRLRSALERSDERFVTVLEGIDAAVLVQDAADSRILYANRRCREVFGATIPDALDEARFASGSGELHDATTDRWYHVQTRRLRWIDARHVRLRVLTDITDEMRAHELINRHRDAMHHTAKLVALGEFASAIAHELSQPLAAIATYSNTSLRLLDAGGHPAADLREAMDKCRTQAKRAGAIIQRLREFLRHRGPALEYLDLNDVAMQAIGLAEVEAAQACVTVEPELAPALPLVRADRILIEQVVLNLVRNAIDALQDAPTQRRRISIGSATSDDGSVTIRVSDHGCGVPPEILPRLFEAFATTRPGGLGLGLSICRSVVQAHGGTIRHAANEGGGSVFSFTLPARRE